MKHTPIETALRDSNTRQRLVRVARKIAHNDADSEDAAHDAIVAVLRHADGFRKDAQISTWMHRIAVNAALMQQRKGGRRNKLTNQLKQASEAKPEALAATPLDPEMEIARAQEQALVRAAVAKLSDTYRQVVELCLLQEESPQSAARRLHLTPGAVRTRLGRARGQLSELLLQSQPQAA